MKKNIALFTALTLCIIASMAAYSKLKNNDTTTAFERIDLHSGIMKEASFVPDIDWYNTVQSGSTGYAEASVTSGGNAGSSTLKLQSTKGFGAEQLIAYEGNDGQYYSAVISQMNGSTITLKSPLEATLSKPQKIHNFYADPDHPNKNGYNVIADYSVRNLPDLNKGKHVLLGDSWFDHSPRYFSDRLASRLPNATVINEGIGGNTTQQLLGRFDTAVVHHKPDTVWIMASTNDYNQYVSKEDYANNIRLLVKKINEIGARALVFNSSVGKPHVHDANGNKYPVPSRVMTILSHDYYEEVEAMIKPSLW